MTDSDTTNKPEKLFVSANDLLNDAFHLGEKIVASHFYPDVLIALWRGGTPVAVAIDEWLTYKGIEHQHFAIKTRHYLGVDHRHDDILIEGLEPVVAALTAESTVLIIDDVFDTGLTLDKVVNTLRALRPGLTEIRLACPYFKPGNNQTQRLPDYYVHTTDQWIVFPHELSGLTPREIIDGKKELRVLADILHR